MNDPTPKRISGPTIPEAERRARGYGRVTLSLPHTANDQIDQLAERLQCSRSAVVVAAVAALAKAKKLPPP